MVNPAPLSGNSGISSIFHSLASKAPQASGGPVANAIREMSKNSDAAAAWLNQATSKVKAGPVANDNEAAKVDKAVIDVLLKGKNQRLELKKQLEEKMNFPNKNEIPALKELKESVDAKIQNNQFNVRSRQGELESISKLLGQIIQRAEHPEVDEIPLELREPASFRDIQNSPNFFKDMDSRSAKTHLSNKDNPQFLFRSSKSVPGAVVLSVASDDRSVHRETYLFEKNGKFYNDSDFKGRGLSFNNIVQQQTREVNREVKNQGELKYLQNHLKYMQQISSHEPVSRADVRSLANFYGSMNSREAADILNKEDNPQFFFHGVSNKPDMVILSAASDDRSIKSETPIYEKNGKFYLNPNLIGEGMSLKEIVEDQLSYLNEEEGSDSQSESSIAREPVHYEQLPPNLAANASTSFQNAEGINYNQLPDVTPSRLPPMNETELVMLHAITNHARASNTKAPRNLEELKKLPNYYPEVDSEKAKLILNQKGSPRYLFHASSDGSGISISVKRRNGIIENKIEQSTDIPRLMRSLARLD